MAMSVSIVIGLSLFFCFVLDQLHDYQTANQDTGKNQGDDCGNVSEFFNFHH